MQFDLRSAEGFGKARVPTSLVTKMYDLYIAGAELWESSARP